MIEVAPDTPVWMTMSACYEGHHAPKCQGAHFADWQERLRLCKCECHKEKE